MKNHFTASQRLPRFLQPIAAFCRSAAEALGVSEGEFWVWYGNPLMLPPAAFSSPKKTEKLE